MTQGGRARRHAQGLPESPDTQSWEIRGSFQTSHPPAPSSAQVRPHSSLRSVKLPGTGASAHFWAVTSRWAAGLRSAVAQTSACPRARMLSRACGFEAWGAGR